MGKSFLVARFLGQELLCIVGSANPDNFAALNFQGRGRFFNELQLLSEITSANWPTKIVFHAAIDIALQRLSVRKYASEQI